MGDFLDYFKQKKNLTSLLLLGIVILGLPIGIQLLKQQQIIKSGAQAGDPIRFIASDTEFQQTSGNDNTWATTDANISFNLYSPFGSPGTAAGTPTPTPSPTPAGGGATPVPTSTPIPTPTPSPTPAARVDRVNINLNAGWNLISFPRPLVNNTLNTFAGTTKLYYFNTSSQAWDWAIWRDGRWNGNLNSLEAGKAYWVEAPAAMTIPVEVEGKNTGSIVRPPITPNSWNMIGYSTLTDQEMDVNAYLASVGITNWETLYKMENGNWSIAKPTGGTFTKVKVGEGYWVKVGAASAVPLNGGIPPN